MIDPNEVEYELDPNAVPSKPQPVVAGPTKERPIFDPAAPTYRDLIQRDIQDEKIKPELLQIRAQNAEEPGKALEIARYKAIWPDIPHDEIARSLPKYRAYARAHQIDFQTAAEDHPVFAEFLGNPETAGLAVADSAALMGIEKVIGRFGTKYIPPAWMEITKDVWTKEVPMMGLQFKEATEGIFPWGDRFNRDERKKSIMEYKDQAPSGKDYTLAKSALAQTLLFPFKIQGAIAANLVAGPMGLPAIFAANTLYNLPMLYDALSEVKTPDGEKKMPEGAAQIAAFVGAPLMSIPMTWGFSPIVAGASKTWNNALLRLADGALHSDSVHRAIGGAIGSLGVHVMEGAASFALMNGIQAAVERQARHYALGDDSMPDEAIYQAMAQGFQQALVDLPAMAAMRPTGALFKRLALHRRAVENFERGKAMTNEIVASKLAQDNPAKYAEYMRRSKAQPGSAQYVYLDRVGLEEHIKSLGEDPEKVIDRIAGRNGTYKRAVASGEADLKIPIDAVGVPGLYMSKDYQQFMWEEARYDAKDISIGRAKRELKEFHANADKRLTDPDVKAIYQEVFDTYKEALTRNPPAKTFVGREDLLADAIATATVKNVLVMHEMSKKIVPVREVYQNYFAKRRVQYRQLQDIDLARHDPGTRERVRSGQTLLYGEHDEYANRTVLFEPADVMTAVHEHVHAAVGAMASLVEAERAASGVAEARRAADEAEILAVTEGGKVPAKKINYPQGPIEQAVSKLLNELGGYTGGYEQRKQMEIAGKNFTQEERITHLFELWALTDYAPSPEMNRLFSLVRDEQYKALIHGMRTPKDPAATFKERTGEKLVLSDSRRAALRAMFRTQEDVIAAQKEARLNANLKEAIDKLDPAEQRQYAKHASEGFRSATEKLAHWIVENSRRMNAKLFREEKAAFAKEGEAEWAKAGNGALQIFMDGKLPKEGPALYALLQHEDGTILKFDPEEIKSLVHETLFNEWKKNAPYMFAKDPEHSLYAGDIARVFGYSDPTEMLGEMYIAGHKGQYVEKYVERKMIEKFGPDLMDNPGAVFDKAAELTHDDATFKRLVLELRAMIRAVDPTMEARVDQISKERMERVAAEMVARKTIGEIDSNKWLGYERSALLRATEFGTKGNVAKVWDHKYQQIMNFLIFKEMRKAERQLEKYFNRLSGRLTEDTYRGDLGKADPAVREAHDAILDAVGIKEYTGGLEPGERLAKFETLIEWAKENFFPIGAFDDTLMKNLLTGDRTWDSLTPKEGKAVFDALQVIYTMAKEARSIKIGDMKAARAELMADALAHVADLKDQPLPARDKALEPFGTKIVRYFQARDANLLEPRVWIGFLGEKVKAAIWDTFIIARDVRERLMKDVHDQFKKDWEAFASRKDRYTILPPEIDTELPLEGGGQRSKMWLMTVMLWMGSVESRQRLLDHTGWSERQVLDAAGKYLTPEDLIWINKQHKLSEEKIFPLASAKNERRVGVPLEPVEAMPYTIKFESDGSERTYDGGYFPIRYDPDNSRLAILRDVEQVAEGNPQGRPATNKGYTQPRSESYKDVPNLSWEIYPAHLASVIHDIAFDEYVSGASRLLLNKDMRKLMTEKLGQQYALQPLAWLNAVAHDADGSTPAHLREINKSMQYVRGTLLYGALGWNAAVVAADILHPIATALMRDGTWYTVTRAVPAMMAVTADAVRGVLGGGPGLRARNTAESMVLQYRSEHAFQEMRRLLSEPGVIGTTGAFGRARDAVKATAFWLMEEVDKLTSNMIYEAKKQQVLAETGDLAAAIRAGNDAVTAAMPTHAIGEMPALLRDKRGAGAMLVFYGYYSKLYNMAREQGHEVAAGRTGSSIGWESAKLAGRVMGMMIVTNVWGDYLMGHGKQEDESWGEWYMRKTLAAPFAMIPYAGSAATALADKIVTGKTSPANILRAPAYALAYQGYDTLGRLMSDNRETDRKVFDVLEFLLMSAQLPARQPRRTAEYLYRTWDNQEKPSGILDFAGNAVYGTKKRAEGNFLTDAQRLLDGR